MSYTIDYRYVAKRILGSTLSDNTDRYVVFVETGDNNVYESSHPSARRSRKWQVLFIGTHDEVMEMAVRFSGSCEGGELKPFGKNDLPETYIRRIRKLLLNAGLIEDSQFGEPFITALEYQCEIGSDDDVLLTNRGLERTERKKFWQEHLHANFAFTAKSHDTQSMFKEFFDIFPAIYMNRPGWHFATCSNPR